MTETILDQVQIFLLQASGPPTITLAALDTHDVPALMTFDSEPGDRPTTGVFSACALRDAKGQDLPITARAEAALRMTLHAPWIANHFAGLFRGMHDAMGSPPIRRHVLATQTLLALAVTVEGRTALPRVRDIGYHHATTDLHPDTECLFIYDRHSTFECQSAHAEMAKRARLRPELELIAAALGVDPAASLTLTA